jgi:zinc protease
MRPRWCRAVLALARVGVGVGVGVGLLAAAGVTAISERDARADVPGAPSSVSRPVTEARLASGLRVVVLPDASSPDVTVSVRYDVGSKDEPTGLEGLAHLVEHLMFGGSKHAARGAHYRLMDQAGATNVNARTSRDATVFHETVPPDRLELALWLESDRMGFLDVVDDAALARERTAVINEYRDRVADVAYGELSSIVAAELFPSWHPYHHLPVAQPKSILRIAAADVRAFLGTWYGPANATLFISGNAQPAAAVALAERYFGSLPPRAPPARPVLPALAPTRTSLIVGADVTRQVVRMSWITPAMGQPGDVELDLAASLLAEQGVGWLQRDLMGSTAYATRIVAGQDSCELASVFSVEVVVATDHTTEEVISVVRRAIDRLGSQLTPGALALAQLAWEHRALFRLESDLLWSSLLGSLAHGRAPVPARWDGLLGRYRGVSVDAVSAAVGTYLGSRRVLAVVEAKHGEPLRGVVLARFEETP